MSRRPKQKVETKPWWKSKILWLNFVAGSLAALDMMNHTVQEFFISVGLNNFGSTAIILIAILNVFFRLITTTAIGSHESNNR